MLRFPNGAGPCYRTTYLIVIVHKITGMAVSRTMNPKNKKVHLPGHGPPREKASIFYSLKEIEVNHNTYFYFTNLSLQRKQYSLP